MEHNQRIERNLRKVEDDVKNLEFHVLNVDVDKVEFWSEQLYEDLERLEQEVRDERAKREFKARQGGHKEIAIKMKSEDSKKGGR